MKYFLTTLLIFCYVNAFCQDKGYLTADNILPKYIPPSPEAANLGKYADIPVGYHTGTPSISIPIFTIQQDGFKLPISLSYHASGIKINQQASWVGLGWVLNAGGVVNRTVMGRDDFLYRINHSSLSIPDPNDTIPLPSIIDMPHSVLWPEEGTRQYYNVVNGSLPGLHHPIYDPEPDIFSFNFNGRAGKFMFKENGEVVLFPHQDLLVKQHPDPTVNTLHEIVDEQGVRYVFDAKEEVRTVRHSNQGVLVDRKAYTAYYLSKIILQTGSEILFHYARQRYSFTSPKQYSIYEVLIQEDDIEPEWVQANNYVDGWYLSSITWDGGEVTFFTEDRLDLDHRPNEPSEPQYENTTPPQKLTGILIENNYNVIKYFQFDQSYFNEASGDHNKMRLRLDRIIEKSSNSSSALSKPPYEFTYDNGNLQSKLTYGDHWGYANGAVSTKGIPAPWGVADREPSFPEMQAGTLKEIQYPTGGRTVFEYESHIYDSTLVKPDLICNSSMVSKQVSRSHEDEVKTISKTFYKSGNLPAQFGFEMTNIRCANWQGSIPPVVACDEDNPQVDRETFGESSIRLLNHAGEEVAMVEWTDYDGTYAGFIYLNGDTYLSPSPIRPNGGFVDSGGIPREYKTLPLGGEFTLEVTIDPDITEGYVNAFVSYNTEECYFPSGERMAGGLRLKRKTNYDMSGIISQVEYEYTDGKLFDKPIYESKKPGRLEEIGNIPFLASDLSSISSGNIVSSPVGKGIHVGYREVKEIRKNFNTGEAENGYTVYKYDNQPEGYHPDDGIGIRNIRRVYSVGSPWGENELLMTLSTGLPDDYAYFYPVSATKIDINVGNLLEKIHYRSDGTRVQRKKYIYQTTSVETLPALNISGYPNEPLSVAAGLNTSDARYSDLTIAIYTWFDYESVHNQLVSEITTEYFEDGTAMISSMRNIKYESDIHLKPTQIEVRTSDGKTKIFQSVYSRDLNGITSLTGGNLTSDELVVIDSMNADNRIELIQSEIYQREGGSGDLELLSVKKNVYDEFNGLELPSKLEMATHDNPLETRLEYEVYNDAGRILQLSKSSDMTIVYFWGYNNQYPIAEIKGVTLAKIASVLESETAETVKEFDETNLSEIESLRTLLPDAQITTYTYNPFVGMLTATDPNGKTTTYSYDGLNRLQNVWDHEDNIIRKIDYKYYNQVP